MPVLEESRYIGQYRLLELPGIDPTEYKSRYIILESHNIAREMIHNQRTAQIGMTPYFFLSRSDMALGTRKGTAVTDFHYARVYIVFRAGFLSTRSSPLIKISVSTL